MYQFPRWDNAPEWSHKGYVYQPFLDDDDDRVKVHHDIYKRIDLIKAQKFGGTARPVFTSNSLQDYSAYQYLTEEQFKEFVTKMDWVLQDGR